MRVLLLEQDRDERPGNLSSVKVLEMGSFTGHGVSHGGAPETDNRLQGTGPMGSNATTPVASTNSEHSQLWSELRMNNIVSLDSLFHKRVFRIPDPDYHSSQA